MKTALIFALLVSTSSDDWSVAVDNVRKRYELFHSWDVDSWQLKKSGDGLVRSGGHTRMRFDRGRFIRMDADVADKPDGKYAAFDGKVARFFAPATGRKPETYSICPPKFAFLQGENPAGILGGLAFHEVPLPLHEALSKARDRDVGASVIGGRNHATVFLPSEGSSKRGRKYFLDPDREYAVARIECYTARGDLDRYLAALEVREWQQLVDSATGARHEFPKIVEIVGESDESLNLAKGIELSFRSLNSPTLDARFRFEVPATSYVDDFISKKHYWASAEAEARFRRDAKTNTPR